MDSIDTRHDDLPWLLKPMQAVEVNGIARTRLFELIKNGEIESVVLGERDRRIPKDALVEYVRKLRSQG